MIAFLYLYAVILGVAMPVIPFWIVPIIIAHSYRGK